MFVDVVYYCAILFRFVFFLVIFFFLVLFFYFRKHSKITAGQKAASSFHLASIQLLNPRLYHPGRCTFCVLPILFILLQCRLLQSVVTITSTSSTTSIAFLLAAISSELCFGALERKTTVTGDALDHRRHHQHARISKEQRSDFYMRVNYCYH